MLARANMHTDTATSALYPMHEKRASRSSWIIPSSCLTSLLVWATNCPIDESQKKKKINKLQDNIFCSN